MNTRNPLKSLLTSGTYYVFPKNGKSKYDVNISKLYYKNFNNYIQI